MGYGLDTLGDSLDDLTPADELKNKTIPMQP
jgi:hypothetical protein